MFSPLQQDNKVKDKKLNNVFFFLLLVTFLSLGYLMFNPFWQPVVFSVFIAIVAQPAHKKIKNLIKNENLASLVSTFLIFLFVLIPGAILSIVIINQALSVIPQITIFISETKDFDAYFQHLPLIGSFYFKIKTTLLAVGVDVDFISFAKNNVGKIANFSLLQGKTILTGFGIIAVQLFFVLLTIFFLFRDGTSYYKFFYDLIPMPDRDKEFLFDTSYQAIKAIFLGTIITALGQASLAFIAYFFVGINYSLFWGFATFIVSFIPLGGAAIVWLPLVLYSFFNFGAVTSVLFMIWCVVIVTGSDNVIRPLIIGGKTNINTLVLTFTILGGVDLFGFIGIFIAPVIIVIINNLLILYKEKYLSISSFDDVESDQTLAT
ncbi:MAG: AI-2E family transporter [Candidatus Sericytochromatia bacterium]|nr:AI-2E family transporter [Candidatus Sericytochromatia bacterium]